MFEAGHKKWVKIVFIVLLALMLIFTILPLLGSLK